MKRNFFGLALMLALLSGAVAVRAVDITPAGRHLAEVLDSMHVDKLWLAGYRVQWRTGEPTSERLESTNGHTHCSAFAAAAAEKLGVYLLRPPEHSATLLANAQQDWLRTTGTNQGWHEVKSPVEAQHLANMGQLVVVTFKNADPKVPGHIAIVRPSNKSEKEIVAEGPQIIQAGRHNYVSTTAQEGFKNHPGAFEKHELFYFSHVLSPAELEAQ